MQTVSTPQWLRATSPARPGDKRRAEQIISCFRGGFIADLAGARDLCDGFQARPLMAFLQPAMSVETATARFRCGYIGVDRGVVVAASVSGSSRNNLNVFVKRA